MTLQETADYRNWIGGLKDKTAIKKIILRTIQMKAGNLGPVKSVGGGVSESKINYGPGYRIYFGRKGGKIIILLGGSSKKSQHKAIIKCQELWKEIKKSK